MPDYKKNIIYKLCCKDSNITDIYVGHTCNFNQRKNIHKIRCNNANLKEHNFRVYKFIRNNGGFNNWEMIQIEEWSCNNSKEALLRERYWVDELKSSLNHQIPMRTQKEYRNVNKNIINEYMKNYRIENREKISQKQSEKVECPHCNNIITKGNLTRHIRNIHNL